MKVRFVTTIDLADASYEAEFADERGALPEHQLTKACAVVRAVLAHLEAGRAQTVHVDRDAVTPAAEPMKLAGKPDPTDLN